MAAKLIKEEVGPWQMNTYLVICDETNSSAIVDPGADAEDILAMAEGTNVEKILITHTHSDHIGALAEVKSATNAPVYVHPVDAKQARIAYDVALQDGDEIEVGNLRLRVIHAPGHTPGQVCLMLEDGRVLVGDTIFVGGPGRTSSHKDFKTTMNTMQEIVFTWPDDTEFYPGHGPSGVIGTERPAFEAFVARGWSSKLRGDVTWE
jgi:glyoxylase-like metal-dependent hydrolase (beta-lactamase superfamily II)